MVDSLLNEVDGGEVVTLMCPKCGGRVEKVDTRDGTQYECSCSELNTFKIPYVSNKPSTEE